MKIINLFKKPNKNKIEVLRRNAIIFREQITQDQYVSSEKIKLMFDALIFDELEK